jgi:hypothetical protein
VLAEAKEPGRRTETFLAGLHFPRFVATSRDHRMADCKVPIDTFFIFLEDTDDGILAQFLPRLPRCWIRARFVVVFPERWRLSGNDHRRKYKNVVAHLLGVIPGGAEVNSRVMPLVSSGFCVTHYRPCHGSCGWSLPSEIGEAGLMTGHFMWDFRWCKVTQGHVCLW